MFLVCGEALCDLLPAPSEHPLTGEIALRARAGGSPFNVAVGLGRLGQPVALATEISDDLLGDVIRATLVEAGVDLRQVRPSSRSTPLALVDLDPEGTPRYAFHGLSQLKVSVDASDLTGLGVTAIHVGSVALVSHRSSDQLLKLVAKARGRMLVTLDPNVRLAVEPDVSVWRAAVDAFRAQAHLVKVSEEDVAALYGEARDPCEVAFSWVEGGCALVVLTRGASGASLFTRNERIDVAGSSADVVDTIGAGDSFQAAMLCWLAERGFASLTGVAGLTRDQLAEMAAFGCTAAALTCSRLGPDLPWRSQLQ